MSLDRIANAPADKALRLHAIRRLLSIGHVRFKSHEYEITDEGDDWLRVNRQVVADAVLEAARGRVPNSVFQLART